MKELTGQGQHGSTFHTGPILIRVSTARGLGISAMAGQDLAAVTFTTIGVAMFTNTKQRRVD